MLHADPDLAWPLRYSRARVLISATALTNPRLFVFLVESSLAAGSLTCPDKLRDVPVAGDLAVGNLLDGSVDRVEKDFGFVGTSHLSSSLVSHREQHANFFRLVMSKLYKSLGESDHGFTNF